jgi:hypothetical protein
MELSSPRNASLKMLWRWPCLVGGPGGGDVGGATAAELRDGCGLRDAAAPPGWNDWMAVTDGTGARECPSDDGLPPAPVRRGGVGSCDVGGTVIVGPGVVGVTAGAGLCVGVGDRVGVGD